MIILQRMIFLISFLHSIAQNTYDGHYMQSEQTESSVAFYYNKDYLKECGVDTDDLDSRTLDNPITWDEMAEIAEKCTTDNYVGTHIIMDHGEGLPYALEPMYISEGKTTSARMVRKLTDM